MVLVTGKYRLEKDENVKEYMKAMGLSEELIEQFADPGMTVEIFEDKNRYTFKSNVGINYSYALNEKFQEPLSETAKSVAAREGDVITVTTKTSDGQVGIRIYEFTESGVTVVLNMNGVTAKRYFKKLNF